MKLKLLSILLLVAGSISAQPQEVTSLTVNTDLFHKLGLKVKENVMNPIYLNEWDKMDITLQTDEIINGIVGKYDIQNNQFEIRTNNKIGILQASRVKNFTIANKEVFVNIMAFESKEGGKYQKGFVQLLFDGKKQKVFRYHQVKIRETSGNFSLGIKGGFNYSKDIVTVIYSKNTFSKLESSKKKNLKFFNEQGREVLKYMKENKLSFKKEEDVKKVFQYYDGLPSK